MFHQPSLRNRVRKSVAMCILAAATLPVLAQEALILQCEGTNPNVTTERGRTHKEKFKLTANKFEKWSDLPGSGWLWDTCDPPKPHWSRTVEAKCSLDGDVVSISSTVVGYKEEFQSAEKILINKKTGFYSHSIKFPRYSGEFTGRCEPIAEPPPPPPKERRTYP